MRFVPVRRELAFRHGEHRLVGDLHLPPTASADAPVPAPGLLELITFWLARTLGA